MRVGKARVLCRCTRGVRSVPRLDLRTVVRKSWLTRRVEIRVGHGREFVALFVINMLCRIVSRLLRRVEIAGV